MDAYHRYWTAFVTKLKDMPDTIRLLLQIAMSW